MNAMKEEPICSECNEYEFACICPTRTRPLVPAPCSARGLAELIASRLFVNGDGDQGTRLDIRQGDPHGEEKSLGGWCLAAAIDQIQKVIEQNVPLCHADPKP